MESFEHRLPADATQAEVEALLAQLNAAEAVDGILLQLPLPGHLDDQAAVATIDPDKDVDRLTPVSAGRLALGIPGMVPCTPYGCMLLLPQRLDVLSGTDAVCIVPSVLSRNPR